MSMKSKNKTKEDTREFAEKVSAHKGWKLNPDDEILGYLIEGLTVNYNRYGYFQCPCRDSWGNREKDRDIICPCAYCVPDQEEYGHCFCSLFLTPEFYSSGATPKSIPERRPQELYPD
jgi:ferredoxin-thioredoxin reductase catalytic chain